MIERYTREKAKENWTLKSRYKCWYNVEVAVLSSLEEMDIIPKGAALELRGVEIDANAILDIEKKRGHDVIAFVEFAASKMPMYGRFLHYGLTSSDVVDTAFSLQLLKGLGLVIEGLTSLITILKERAMKYQYTVMVGRTHGVHAEPYSFGLKVLTWYKEAERNLVRLEQAKKDISFGKISGAVGTYAHLPPKVEELALARLGLDIEPVSTQIIPRDRYAFLFSMLAILAGSIERVAMEIRHLQRTEVLEVEEPFGSRQRGSSAMPHKKNPILCENLCGLARLMRSYVNPVLENIALWHERDISHSSVERVISEDALILADFMIHRLKRVIEGLVVHGDRMEKNLDLLGGMIYSQRVLLKLIEKGITRNSAYEIVQNSAKEAFEWGSSFKEILIASPEVKQMLTENEIKELFSYKHYLKHIDHIFKRNIE